MSLIDLKEGVRDRQGAVTGGENDRPPWAAPASRPARRTPSLGQVT